MPRRESHALKEALRLVALLSDELADRHTSDYGGSVDDKPGDKLPLVIDARKFLAERARSITPKGKE